MSASANETRCCLRLAAPQHRDESASAGETERSPKAVTNRHRSEIEKYRDGAVGIRRHQVWAAIAVEVADRNRDWCRPQRRGCRGSVASVQFAQHHGDRALEGEDSNQIWHSIAVEVGDCDTRHASATSHGGAGWNRLRWREASVWLCGKYHQESPPARHQVDSARIGRSDSSQPGATIRIVVERSRREVCTAFPDQFGERGLEVVDDQIDPAACRKVSRADSDRTGEEVCRGSTRDEHEVGVGGKPLGCRRGAARGWCKAAGRSRYRSALLSPVVRRSRGGSLRGDVR